MALMLSVAAGFVSDYLDPSFRTPDEIDAVLAIPLLACFAKNGSPPRFGHWAGSEAHLHHQLGGEEDRSESLST
jgi:hypothetical protein